MRQNIAPVVVVLNEIALREPYTVSDALPGNANSRDGEGSARPCHFRAPGCDFGQKLLC